MASTSEAVMLAAQKVRELCRAALADPAAEPLLWNYVEGYRRFFHRHAPSERFITEFDSGVKIWVSLRDHIESMIYFHDMQEGDRGLVRLLKNLWSPGGVFIDVGANVGVYTLMAARRVGSGGIVHSYEPVRSLFQLLEANVALNGFTQVRAHRVALSRRSGTATIYVPYHNNRGMASLHAFPGEARAELVATSTLDEEVKRWGLTRIDVIKVDVEGHELAVFEGACLTLERLRPVVACELSRQHLARAGTSPEEVAAFLRARGYECYLIDAYGGLARGCGFPEHGNALFWPAERPLAGVGA